MIIGLLKGEWSVFFLLDFNNNTLFQIASCLLALQIKFCAMLNVGLKLAGNESYQF